MVAMSRQPRLGSIVAALACVALGACSSWRVQQRFDHWTLHTDGEQTVEADAFRSAFTPAFATVEGILGAFERPVDVYVWNGRARASGESSDLAHGEAGLSENVPGIGLARVRAFHARGHGWFGARSGVYIESPDAGTAVHELVHARLAEDRMRHPLWLEEGLACLLGDGFQDGGRWIVDGLACWPLRELALQELDDPELAKLLLLRAEDRTSARENVLVHFVGWAIAFDLYRENGEVVDWERWSKSYARSIPLAEARTRLERTLAPETLEAWLARLKTGEPEQRIATAKGLWKLRSPLVFEALVAALKDETEPRVRVGLAVNAIAAAGELELSGPELGRMWRAIWSALRRAKVEDPSEQEAVAELFRSLRQGAGQRSQPALEKLAGFWSE
jgi:hypothetical protein